MLRRRGKKDRTGAVVVRTDDEWRAALPPDRYAVLRQGATERAGSGEHVHPGMAGRFRCAGCDAPLFDAGDQYDSGTGWPSFTRPVAPDAVEHHRDVGMLGVRTEVRCRSCGGHLGHVFGDGPRPTRQRYCMNSLALQLDPA